MSESAEESQRSGAQRRDPWLDRSEEVGPHVASTVKKMVRDLQDLASAAEDEAVGQLLAATARVDGETTQSGILNALLEESQRFASRAAFFLTRPGEVRGWSGRGFSNVDGARFDYEESGLWSRMAAQTGVLNLNGEDSGGICRSLGADAGVSGVMIPFILRGQLGGVLYADRLEGEGGLGVASLQLLTHSAAQAVETAAVRGGGSSPALHLSSAAASQASLWQPPEDATPAAAAPIAAVASAAAAIAGATAVAEEVTKPAEPEMADVDESPVVSEEPPAEDLVEASDELESSDEVDEQAEVDEQPLAEEVEVAEADELEVEEVVEAAPAAVAESAADAEAVDFEMVSEGKEDLQAVEDIEAELEPEPELEDTSDLWAVEEEEAEEELEDDEEEATFVGPAPVAKPVPEPAPAPQAMPVSPEVGQETVRLDIAALQGQMPTMGSEPAIASEPAGTEDDTTKLPQWEVEAAPEPAAPEFELEPEVEPTAPTLEEVEPTAPTLEVEPQPEEPVTATMSTPDFSEDATIISPREDITSPTDGGYVPPAPVTPSAEVTPPADLAPATTEVTPPAEVTPPPSTGFAAPPAPKPDATGTSQVVPPTDIQGPGSAFGASSSGAIPEGEEALHEEARRLARLLVSEIKLYNEEIIEEGRRSGNIYDRLKDDIDRSRQMYEERIDPRLLNSGNDYFRQELVQRLAGGDERLLGY